MYYDIKGVHLQVAPSSIGSIGSIGQYWLDVVLSLCVVLSCIGSIELYWNTCSIEMGVWGIEMAIMLY